MKYRCYIFVFFEIFLIQIYMQIVIDKDIPFIKGVFEPFAEVVYEKGGDINRKAVKNADALIIRTRTKCNKELLEGSRVKIIASATIGKDHVDTAYCDAKGITFINAAGCNANGVVQYVFTALYAVAGKKRISLPVSGKRKRVLGVIGVGNVGSRVALMGEYLGMEVLRNDPLKEREQTLRFNAGYIPLTEFKNYYSLDYVLAHSDIITVHVYLDETTRNMVNSHFLEKVRKGAVFINSSRGEVVDEAALLRLKDKFSAIILDVWGHEPAIDRELLASVDIATPHIAGYSYEGKINGTVMVVKGVAGFLGIEPLKYFTVPPDTPNPNHLELKGMDQAETGRILTDIFPVFEESRGLKDNPGDFEKIRNNYKYRREFYVK